MGVGIGSPGCAGHLKYTHPHEPRKRLELIKTLLAALASKRNGSPNDPALCALLERERAKLSERVKTV